MGASRIRIERLHVTVVGVTREEAARLGADVARHVGTLLPAAVGARARGVGALRVRVDAEAGASGGHLAERIAGVIARSLRW